MLVDTTSNIGCGIKNFKLLKSQFHLLKTLLGESISFPILILKLLFMINIPIHWF